MWIDYSEKIGIKNLKIIFNTEEGVPSISNDIISMNQAHSTNVSFISKNIPIDKPSDAIFTLDHRIAIEIKVADCMPIFFFDEIYILNWGSRTS